MQPRGSRSGNGHSRLFTHTVHASHVCDARCSKAAVAPDVSHKKREFFGLCASALASADIDKYGYINVMSP